MPPKLPTGDPAAKLAAFLSEAKQTIVVEGGINPTSLVKLRMVGQRHGLSPEEIDAALKQLQRPAAASPELTRFRQTVEARLRKDGVLTPLLKRNLLDAARKDSLSDSAAESVIQEAVADCGVSVITDEQAMQHISAQLEGMLDEGPLTRQQMAGLYTAALHLGLTKEQVKDIVDRIRLGGREIPADVNWGLVGGITACGVLVLAIVGFVIWQATIGPDEVPPPPIVNNGGGPGPNPGHSNPGQVTLAQHPELGPLLKELKQLFPQEQGILDRLGAAGERDRASAYESVFLRLPTYWQNPKAKELLSKVLVFGYALDPAEPVAEVIANRLSGLLPTKEAAVPARFRPDFYERSFWALETAVEAVLRQDTKPERADALSKKLEDRLGINFDRAAPLKEQTANASKELCLRFYDALIDYAASEPLKALPMRAALEPIALKLLPADQLERLDVDFLVAGLDRAGAGWNQLEPLIDKALASKDRGNLFKVVDFYENSSTGPVEQRLQAGLLQKFPVRPSPLTKQTLAEAVRNFIGRNSGNAAVTVAGSNRAERFLELARQNLTKLNARPEQAEKLLDEVVLLAHTSTLGLALHKKEEARFDELFSKGPHLDAKKPGQTAVVAPSRSKRPRQPGVGLGLNGDLDEMMKELASLNSFSRRNAFQRLGSLSTPPEDFPPEIAEKVALYLFTSKAKDELDSIVFNLKQVGRARPIRLAAADVVLETRATAPPAQVERLLLEMAPASAGVKLTTDANWRKKARKLLLEAVLSELGSTSSVDDAAALLFKVYQQQGLLLGMSEPEFLLMTRPSQAQEALVGQLLTRVSKDKLPEPEKDRLARIPHELKAKQFMAANDLQLSVLLQRVWVDLLALYAAQERPQRAADARKIADELRTEDARAASLLAQLHAGEVRALRLWLLLNEP
jgi:hypothetical protein